MTDKSWSVIRREALQQGEPMPDFEGGKEAITHYDVAAELYAWECEALKSLIDDFGWPPGGCYDGMLVVQGNRSGIKIDTPIEGDGIVVYTTRGIKIDTAIEGDGRLVYTTHGIEQWYRTSPIYALPCGATEKMLREFLGDSLRAIIFPVPEDPLFSCIMINLDSSFGDTLTLALCAAVRAKLKAK